MLAVVLSRALPPETDHPRLRYGSLLRSTVSLFLDEPLLRRRIVFGALGMAAFSAFWTTMAFVLSGAPYHYGDAAIGLFGLVGAAAPCRRRSPGGGPTAASTRRTTGIFAA